MSHRPRRASRPAALVLLLCALLAAACGDKPKPGETHGNIVIHALDSKADNPTTTFDTSPGGPAQPLPTGDSVKGRLTGHAFDGTPTVGALFLETGSSTVLHFCTASVVRSDAGDLIATAAHCIYNPSVGGFLNHIMFVPGYHDNAAPYGMWIATTAYVDEDWVKSSNPDLDVAFLAVRRLGGGGGTLESVTGAGRYQADPGYSTLVDVVAYPVGAAKPLSCAATTTEQSPTQLEFDCAAYADGSSGAPFLTQDDAVVGVVGGYQQGGDTPDISFSSYFGARVTALYGAAASAPAAG